MRHRPSLSMCRDEFVKENFARYSSSVDNYALELDVLERTNSEAPAAPVPKKFDDLQIQYHHLKLLRGHKQARIHAQAEGPAVRHEEVRPIS